MYKIYTLSIIFLFCALGLKAQQAVVASGGEATGSTGTVSYSIGQVDYITAEGNGKVSAGVQQPYEIYVATGVHESNISLACDIYPNPTTDFIVLNVQNDDFNKMSYSLYDITDKLISNAKLSTAKTTISMTGLANAVYMLKVFNNNNEVKSFKIIKNK